jgi:predicted enzyme related to lactoylglutathione lyase
MPRNRLRLASWNDGAGVAALADSMWSMANVWSAVTIDCLDPERVARFWSTLLGRAPGPSEDGWVYLGERGDPVPRLVFQPVAEPAAGKVRIHLDVTVDDLAESVATVVRLGGRETGERHEYDEGVVVVMADPEGHEFCLVEYVDPPGTVDAQVPADGGHG